MSFIDGWYMYDPLGLPYIYDSVGSNYTPTIGRPYYSWAFQQIWQEHDAAIIFQNNTSDKVKFTKVGIQTVSCKNNGIPFWGDEALMGKTADGGSAVYNFYLDKLNLTGTKDMEEYGSHPIYASTGDISSSVSISVDPADFNLNYPGTSTNDTAIFGEYPFTGTSALTYREFELDNSPELSPGDYAALRIAVSNMTSSNTCIRFIMNPNDMNIEYVLEPQAKIWRMCSQPDGSQKWQLVELAQTRTQSGWTNIKSQE